MHPPRPVTRASLILIAAALALTGCEGASVHAPRAAASPAAAPAATDSPVSQVVRTVAAAPPLKAASRLRAAAARPVAVRPVARRPVVRRVPAPTVRRLVESPAQRGARVLASLHYPYQRLGYRIQFLPDKHGYLGLTVPEQRLIQIYVRSSESDLVLSHSIAHEIGHALDFSRSSLVTHRTYLTMRGLSTSRDWFGCSGCTDYRTPAGDWAEVFAYWLAGPGDYRSQVAGAPSRTQLRALGALFAL